MMTISIVLADDHPITREGMRNVLSAEPDFFLVGEAEDGVRALELVAQLQPDVLVLDMNMPSLDGFGVMQQIKQYSPRTRVIVFSMSDEEGYVWLTFKRGAAGYVLKSAPADELVIGIREVVAGRRYLSPPLSDRAVEAFLRQDEAPPPIANTPLSQREREVLQLLAKGHTNAKIAQELSITTRTAAYHVHNLLIKLDANNRTEAVTIAHQRGWLRDECGSS